MNLQITKFLAEREKNDEKIAKLDARSDEINKQVTNQENLMLWASSGRMGVTPDNPAVLMQAARQSEAIPDAPTEDVVYQETVKPACAPACCP